MSQVLNTGRRGKRSPRITSGMSALLRRARLAPRIVDDARIDEIRRQIAAGTYLTEEKIELAVDRLHTLLTVEGRGPRRIAAAG